jgi:DNA topoisomerase-1
VLLRQSQTTTTKSVTPKARTLKRKKGAVAVSSSDDDVPLASTPSKPKAVKSAAVPMPGAMAATTVTPAANGHAKARTVSKPTVTSADAADDEPAKKSVKAKRVKKEESDDDDDVPLAPKKAPARKKRKVKEESDAEDAEDEEEDDKPLKKKVAKKASSKKVKKEEDDDADDVKPSAKKGKAKKEADEKPKKGKAKKEDEEKEDVFRWWDQDANGDGSDKWQTLVHSGVYFPPPYEPLPKTVKMMYGGECAPSLSRLRSLPLQASPWISLLNPKKSQASTPRW